jgi:hypothetical protein
MIGDLVQTRDGRWIDQASMPPARPEFSQITTGQQSQSDSLVTDIGLPVSRRRVRDGVMPL